MEPQDIAFRFLPSKSYWICLSNTVKIRKENVVISASLALWILNDGKTDMLIETCVPMNTDDGDERSSRTWQCLDMTNHIDLDSIHWSMNWSTLASENRRCLRQIWGEVVFVHAIWLRDSAASISSRCWPSTCVIIQVCFHVCLLMTSSRCSALYTSLLMTSSQFQQSCCKSSLDKCQLGIALPILDHPDLPTEGSLPDVLAVSVIGRMWFFN